jgi:hypothetical protein
MLPPFARHLYQIWLSQDYEKIQFVMHIFPHSLLPSAVVLPYYQI